MPTSTVLHYPRSLIVANAAAVSLYIAFGLARHAPLEIFPRSWRTTLIRWRRAHSARRSTVASTAVTSPVARKSPFDVNQADAKFKAWPALNDDASLAAAAGPTRRQRLEQNPQLDRLFVGDSLQCRLSRVLAARNALDRKEFFETWEFFEQARASLQCGAGCKTFCEVAGGHGLLGVLVAVFERSRFDRVVIADLSRPASHSVIVAAAASVAPWVAERVTFTEADFTDATVATQLLPEGCAVACVHGCKSLTDKVIASATAARAESLVVLPCCYAHAEAAEAAPQALRAGMGVALAADVHRTYRLEDLGYRVVWRHIPSVITPMNRLLVARRRRDNRRDRRGAQPEPPSRAPPAVSCAPCSKEELSISM